MGNSLQDQLLKAGVIDKQKAQKANGERRKKQKLKYKGAASTDKTAEAARLAQAEKIARDQQLNRQKQEEAERRAIAAQIRQLIELNRVARDDGETPYNFVDDKKVRTIYVSDEVHARLSHGQQAIVRFDDGYEVVPVAVADKISERDSSVVIAGNQASAEAEEDDAYADYKVPDDLMW